MGILDVEQDAATQQSKYLLPEEDFLRKHKSWFTGLAGLGVWTDGTLQSGARRDAMLEISRASDDARSLFIASLDAAREAKGQLKEADLQQALDDMRNFQKEANAGTGKAQRFLHRQVEEFKAFLSRGQLVELAVGVVLATAFTSVVRTFVTAFLTPTITLALGSTEEEVAQLVFHVNGVPFPYGTFLAAIIQFLLSAAFLYFGVMKPYSTLVRRWENAKVFHSIAGILRHQDGDKKLMGDVSSDSKGATKECNECLSEIPGLARRCKFCTSVQVDDSESPVPASSARRRARSPL